MEPNNAATGQTPIEDLHAQSVEQYPKLNLSDREHVLKYILRHPIGKIAIWSEMGFLVLLVLAGLIWYSSDYSRLSARISHVPNMATAGSLAAILILLFAAIAYIASYIYNGNRIYLTNESIIQHVQRGLFNTANEQLNLVKIEDVEVVQNGILPKLLHYGTLEINTLDSRDPHVLTLVRDPQTAADEIHNASELALSQNPAANVASTVPANS